MMQLEARLMSSEEGWSRCRLRGGGCEAGERQWMVWYTPTNIHVSARLTLRYPKYETCDIPCMVRYKGFWIFLVRGHEFYCLYYFPAVTYFMSKGCETYFSWHFRLHLIQVTAHSTHKAWRRQKANPRVTCLSEPFLLRTYSQYTTNINIPYC